MPDKSPEELIREKKVKAGGGGRMTTTQDDRDRSAVLAQIRNTPTYKKAFAAEFDPVKEWGMTTLSRGSIAFPRQGPARLTAPPGPGGSMPLTWDWWGFKHDASAKDNADHTRESIFRHLKRGEYNHLDLPFRDPPEQVDEKQQYAALLGYFERKEFQEREAESRKRKIHRTRKDLAGALQDAFKGVEGVEVEVSPDVLEEYKK
jgi:hypothetical protein